jgi:PleD family two-component response regulator
MMETDKTKKNKEGSILIVDDTPENLTVLRKILTENGFRVRPAISGEIALKTVQTDIPDLILLDIVMPNMDGYEVCRKLKAEKRTRNIPIIFISALNELEDKVKAFAEGGVDYITKPFQITEVLARATTHISLHSLQKRLEKKNSELLKAIDEVKQLRGFLPTCSSCKSIRDDQGYLERIETYISNYSEATFAHGICPDCATTLCPEFVINKD